MNSKRKICYVVTVAVTIRAFFVSQLRYLADNGFEVTVICSPDALLSTDLGGNVRYIPLAIPRGISFVGMLRSIFALFRLFKREQFELIQYSTPNAAFCSALAGWLAGCQKRNYHLMGFRYLGASGVLKWGLKQLERITCRLSTSVECVSASNLDFGVAEGIFPEKKTVVVWNGSSGGVDLGKFNFARRNEWRCGVRAALGYDKEDFIFGFAGRITRDKGVNEILSAFHRLQKPAKLLLVGNAEGLNTLDQALLAMAKRNKDIIFHKSVNDIERYFAAMDVLLLPSYREGFGNVIVEAAAVGTPAIVSNIPGPVDAVEEGKTALTVPPKDPNALLAAMDRLNGRQVFEPAYCNAFVVGHFDSERLNREILKRKMQL